MHRLVAILLGLVMASISGHVSALHIHLYTDHDHPEHHHGLAAHEHHRSAAQHDADGPTLESCDPGAHAVAITMGCAPLPHARVMDAEYAGPRIVEPLAPARSFHPITEVRVHGPPPRTDAPPRAPPLIFPA